MLTHFLKKIHIASFFLFFTGCLGPAKVNTLSPSPNVTKQTESGVHASDFPVGAIQRGTLANAQLIEDAKVGVVAQAATLGITNLIKADIFVMQMPEGEPGSRHWKEKWIVSDGTKSAEVDIRFQESGLGAANWIIE